MGGKQRSPKFCHEYRPVFVCGGTMGVLVENPVEKVLVILIPLFFSSLLASGAGSTGGSLFVPFFVLLIDHSTFAAYTKSCTTMTVLNVTIINIIMQLIRYLKRRERSRNKNKKRYLEISDVSKSINNGEETKIHNGAKINYMVASQMAPMSILGASVGVRLNHIVPLGHLS